MARTSMSSCVMSHSCRSCVRRFAKKTLRPTQSGTALFVHAHLFGQFSFIDFSLHTRGDISIDDPLGNKLGCVMRNSRSTNTRKLALLISISFTLFPFVDFPFVTFSHIQLKKVKFPYLDYSSAVE